MSGIFNHSVHDCNRHSVHNWYLHSFSSWLVSSFIQFMTANLITWQHSFSNFTLGLLRQMSAQDKCRRTHQPHRVWRFTVHLQTHCRATGQVGNVKWTNDLHSKALFQSHCTAIGQAQNVRWTIDLHSTVPFQSHRRFSEPSSKASNPHRQWACQSTVTINWVLVLSDKYHLSLPTTCIWLDAWVDYSTTSNK